VSLSRLVPESHYLIVPVLNQCSSVHGLENGASEGALQEVVEALEKGTADVALLKRAALFCVANPAIDPLSPLSISNSFSASSSPFLASTSTLGGTSASGIWAHEKNFGRLFAALRQFLHSQTVRVRDIFGSKRTNHKL